ncbi:MAG: hypothetical protein KDC61_02365 [Saprospiraceae bacterium]|nr:hypothetical protein [Saprospiraceae bacterium]
MLQNAVPAPSEKEARIAWIFTRNHAHDAAHYAITEDPLGRRFSFVIKNEGGEPLAVHPDFYSEKHLAEQARDAVLHIFEQHKMDAPLLQRPDVWTWELTDGTANTLLQNAYPFASEEQAALALCEALALAADPTNYERTFDAANGEYSFFLVQYAAIGDGEPTFRIAAHPVQYADAADPANAEAQRDAAITQTIAAAQAEAAFSGKILPNANAQRFRLCDSDGSLVLAGVEIFPDRASLDTGWQHFLSVAASVDNYGLDKEDGFRVWLEDEGLICAEAPMLFANENDARAHIAHCAFVAGIQRPAPKIATLDKAWTFRLTDSSGKAVMTACTWHETEKEAQAAYLSALLAARQPDNIAPHGDSVHLLDAAGHVLAVSIEKYPETAQREQQVKTWAEWFASQHIRPRLLVCPGEWYFEINKDGVAVLESVQDYAEQAAAALDLEAAIRAGCEGTYQSITAEDACQFSFVVTDKANGKTLAAHPFWYDASDALNANIVALTEWFCTLQLDVAFPPFEPAHYHWELIWETCDGRIEPVLVSQHSFASVAEAETDFLLQMDGAIDKLEPIDGNGEFSFQLNAPNGTPAAMHPHNYPTAQERDKVLEDLKSYLKAQIDGGWCKITPNDVSISPFCWHYRLEKADTVATFCPQFVSRAERNEFLKKLLGGVECKPPFHHFNLTILDADASIVHKDEDDAEPRFSYRVKSGTSIWWESDYIYDSEAAARIAFQNKLETILSRSEMPGNYVKINDEDNLRSNFELKIDDTAPFTKVHSPRFPNQDLNSERDARVGVAKSLVLMFPAEGQKFGFELRFAGKLIYSSPMIYGSAEEAMDGYELFKQDICLLQLLDAFSCHKHAFSSLDFTPNVAKKVGTQYIFQLKTGGQVWWQSVKKYGSPSEAFDAFEAEYLEIVRLAKDADNYEAICKDGEACRFVLKNEEDQIVACSPHFDPDAVREAYEMRLRHALTYPVFADDAQFGFQLYDFPHRETLFLSTRRYDSAADALDAFQHFLELLRHPENLKPLNSENECIFSFSVQEAGLEDIVCNLEENSEAAVWKSLNEKVLTRFEESVHFYSCFDALAGCRFRLFLAKDDYRVARSCQYFHTAQAREEVRDELFSQICCGTIPLPEAWDFCSGFFNGINEAFPWQPNRGMLLSDLKESACYEEIVEICNPDENFFSAQKLIDLMAYARSLDCYVKVSEPGSGCEPGGTPKIRLGLLGAQNQLIAFGKEVFTSEKAWTIARNKAIRQAWQFPLVRWGKGFGFQMAGPVAIVGESVQVEILFESIFTYSSPEVANTIYEKFFKLIKTKTNWQRTETDDCGPFGIEIVDPEAVLAEHPATYPRRDQLAAAQEVLQTCLESEGFHVLEHILLRPRDEGDRMMSPCVPPGQCSTNFMEKDDATGWLKTYLPGLDPYSFWATVVIPHWSPRFRNLNLRNFFEKTLRQEAPAHVALRIAWVDAQQMKDFEMAYRNWLETQSQGETSCGRQTALNELLYISETLRNRYPPSSLYSENISVEQLANTTFARLDYTVL